MLNLQNIINSKIRCVGLGEVLFDIIENNPKLGGAPANFAYHCKQQGLESMVVSALGDDKLGQIARAKLALRFLPNYIPTVKEQTGYVDVKLDADGIANYTFSNDSAYDNIPLTDELLEIAKSVNVVCFGSLAQRNTVSRQSIYAFLDAMDDNSIKIYDINLRQNFYNKEVILESLHRANVFKCNEDEIDIICNYLECNNTSSDLFAKLQNLNVNCFIFTKGADESQIFLNDSFSCIKTPKVKVVDTVGAGDSFTATFIASLLKGDDLFTAHNKDVKLAAFVCEQRGAMPNYNIDDVLKNKSL